MSQNDFEDFVTHCKQGNLVIVGEIFERYKLDTEFITKIAPVGFYHATDAGQFEVLKYFLSLSIDQRYKDQFMVNYSNKGDCGRTPLIVASSSGHLDCLRLVLESGANVNQADRERWSPLMHASSLGNAECVKLLLENGAKVDTADREEYLPLTRAASNGYTQCVKLLLESGANINQRDNGGWSPLMRASSSGKTDCVLTLLQNGAKVNRANKDGWTPLMIASYNGSMDCIKLLLQFGADVNSNLDSHSSLVLTSQEGHLDCAKLLLEHGANLDQLLLSRTQIKVDSLIDLFLAYPNHIIHPESYFVFSSLLSKADDEGRTALHRAIVDKKSAKEIIALIGAYPAAVSQRDNKGNLPFNLAATLNHELSVLWHLLLPLQVYDFTSVSDYNLLYSATRVTQQQFQCVHIHLCGHGYAGKTTCRTALNYTLKCLNYFKFALSNSPREVNVNRCDGLGRTEGMEIDVLETAHHKWAIRDYGGQEDFHVNHARFLSISGSIYVIIVALWNAETSIEFTEAEIRSRYEYWLKFLNSISDHDVKVHCITVVNFAEKVSDMSARNAMNIIKECNKNWSDSSSVVKFLGEPVVVSVNKTWDVRRLHTVLMEAADVVGATNYKVLKYIGAIEESFEKNASKQKKLIRKSQFIDNICMPAIRSIIPNSRLVKGQVDYVCDKMIDYLCTSGEIMIVATSSSKDPLIVMDINWLAKDLLGKLTSNMSNAKNMMHILTARQINEFTEGGSRYFGGLEGLVTFLENIGACVCLKSENDSDVKRWFPICSARSYIEGQECIPEEIKDGPHMKNRKVLRKFQLKYPQLQLFPAGYFTALFLKIISLFFIGDTSEIKVYLNGLELKSILTSGIKLQLLVTVDESHHCFTVSITSIGSFSTPLNGFSECWKKFVLIRDLILNTAIAIERNDFMKSTPWFDCLRLNEIFIDPTNVDSTKDLDEMKTLNTSLFNMYYYGCDESLLPVNEKDNRLNIFAELFKKVDKVQSSLNELNSRWNTVNVHLTTEFAEYSLTNLLADIKESITNDVEEILSSSIESIKCGSFGAQEVQSMIESMKHDLKKSSNNNVMERLDSIQLSLSSVNYELQLIQKLKDENIQKSVLKALESSTSLQRINNMLTTMVMDTHSVPTLAIVIPADKNTLSSFNPRNWISWKFRLFFLCSHTLQVVPCGPKGMGYEFYKPKEWFQKVAPLIKISLVAAKVAMAIHHIPLPLSGLNKALDKATQVEDSIMYLTTALSIMNAADENAASIDGSERFIDSLNHIVSQSNTIEAYRSIEMLINELDPTYANLGLLKVIAEESGITGWIRNDPDVIHSFHSLQGERCPLEIDDLKRSYTSVSGANQSALGKRSGLWLPVSLFSD